MEKAVRDLQKDYPALANIVPDRSGNWLPASQEERLHTLQTAVAEMQKREGFKDPIDPSAYTLHLANRYYDVAAAVADLQEIRQRRLDQGLPHPPHPEPATPANAQGPQERNGHIVGHPPMRHKTPLAIHNDLQITTDDDRLRNGNTDQHKKREERMIELSERGQNLTKKEAVELRLLQAQEMIDRALIQVANGKLPVVALSANAIQLDQSHDGSSITAPAGIPGSNSGIGRS
jgi:hypothetical protein